MGATSYGHKVIAPESIVDINDFDFDLETMTFSHKLSHPPKESGGNDDDASDGPNGYQDVASPFGAITFLEHVLVQDIGSVASQKARQETTKPAIKTGTSFSPMKTRDENARTKNWSSRH